MTTTIFFLALVTKQWPLAHGAKSFSATIGQQCLTSDAAAIDADDTLITLTESPDCAAEIKEIATSWMLFRDTDAIVTVTGSPAALVEKRLKLEAQFGKSPNPRLRFLAATQHCHCLVIAGKQSLAASQAMGGTPPNAPHAKRAHLDNQFLPHGPEQQGLIWHAEPSHSIPSTDKPLVN